MNKEQIMQLKLSELRVKCDELGLETKGNRKTIFQNRLFEHFEITDDEEDGTEDEDNAQYFVPPENTNNKEKEIINSLQNFTLRDIQDSMTYFDGKDHPEIEHWLIDFEENANAVNWTDLQKFVYSKQLLRGAAQMFVRSQNHINTWPKLKAALQKEFGEKLTTADRHRMLSSIKKENRESLLELLYRIIEIAKPINVDNDSIIEYFTNAIPDNRNNKIVLYEATSIDELKTKIKIYEKIKGYDTQNKTNDFKNRQDFKKCFRCPNLKNHASEECRKLNKICFKCNRKGHNTTECRSHIINSNNNNRNNSRFNQSQNNQSYNNQSQNNQSYNNQSQNNQSYNNQHQNSQSHSNQFQTNRFQNNQSHSNQNRCFNRSNISQTHNRSFNQQNNQNFNQNCNRANDNPDERNHVNLANVAVRLYKDIQIDNIKFRGLLDTGSDLCLIAKSIFDTLKNIELIPDITQIIGIGQGVMNTLGYVTAKVKIDNVEFQWHFHIVNDYDITPQCIIGSDILRVVDINLNTKGATFQFKNSQNILNNIECETQNMHYQNKIVTQAIVHSQPIDDYEITSQPDDDNEIYFNTNPEYVVSVQSKFRTLGATYIEETLQTLIEEGIKHLKPMFKEKFKSLIFNYIPIQIKESPIAMKLILTDDIPVRLPPRRLPLLHQKLVEEQVSNWLQSGIIKHSTSEYASPILLATKKDGTKRLCVDFRKLNTKIVKDNFPMMLIEDIIAKLQNAKVFTTLDLRNSFFHVPVDIYSQKYTSFVTHNSQFEFQKVPFGLCNSPAVFCRYITAVFQEIIQDGTITIYMDDVIIPAQNTEESLVKLERMLYIAKDYGIEINWKKCQFAKTEINFLGYQIKNSTIFPSEEKLKAVKNYKQPRNIKSLQRYLGLTSYFRRFINNYAIIAKPLTDLLSKNSNFEFNDDQTIAFEELKNALMTAPVLKLFNPSALTEVHTDASSFGYGAVLLQKDSEDQCYHPVEYMSRKTTPAESKYSSYELEVLAIISALKKWRFYLLGMQFKIITDCNAFTQTISKKDVPAKVARWIIFLQDFSFATQHRSGTKMKHVDALSRVCALMTQSSLKQSIIAAQDSDEFLSAVKKVLKENKEFQDYYLKYNVIFKDPNRELLVVPEAMQRQCIELAHKQGHFAVKKTMELVQKHFYIKNLEKKVENFIKGCIECILINQKQGKKEGFLNSIDKSNRPLETYHIDHVGPLESTKKLYNHILVVVDSFSKFVWLYPTKSTGSEEVINRLTKQAEIFGNPKRIISDRGTAYTSHAFKNYCSQNDIMHHLITTGVPRGNGQVERVHKTVISILSKLCLENDKNWYKRIGTVQQLINNTASRSTKFTPFKLLTGLDMRTNNFETLNEILETEEIEELQNDKDEIRRIARENIEKVQEENRKTYNKNRKKEREYDTNELVAIKRTQFGSNLKIKPSFFGPYKIVRKLRKGRYVVQKVGETEGPNTTTTAVDFMKPWQEPGSSLL